MKNKLFKLFSGILGLAVLFAAGACTSNEDEEIITEVDDTLYLDEQIDVDKEIPEEISRITDDKALYNAFKYRYSLDTASSDSNNHNHDNGWTAWGSKDEEKTSMPNKTGKYYLTSDITLSRTWTVPSTAGDSCGFNICLNGHVIKLVGCENSSVMFLNTFSDLSIYDCSDTDCYLKVVKGGAWEVLGVGIEKPSDEVIELTDYMPSTPNGTIVHTTGGCITGGTYSAIKVNRDIYFSAAYLSIHGGNFVGNTSPDHGGGINYGDCMGVMNGGNVVGNYAPKSGGGIALQGPYNCACEAPRFTMNGGNVIGNTCGESGGGIFNNQNFATTINGGLILSNKATKYGGGIYSTSKRDFKIFNDQTLIGCNEAQLGGGIYVSTASNLTISGGIIVNNKAVNGGGIYVGNTFTSEHCYVLNNVASGNRGGGGGIYARSSSNITIKDIIVRNNTANYGGALDIANGAVVNIFNGEFIGNTAKKLGGGVCLVAGGNLTVGGLTAIANNNLNGKVNNIYLPVDVCLSVSTDNPLKAGANLGITLEKLPANGEKIKFTNNGSDAKYFSSDNENYEVEVTSTYLSISKK